MSFTEQHMLPKCFIKAGLKFDTVRGSTLNEYNTLIHK